MEKSTIPRLRRSTAAFAAMLLGFAAELPGEVLSPDQVQKILAELQRVDEIVSGKQLEGRRSAFDAFRRGAANEKDAYELFLACSKQVDFDEQGKTSTEFREWRERQEANLKRPSRMAAMQMQLQYLVLTLRLAQGEAPLKVLPEVETFLAALVSNAESLEGDLAVLQRESVLSTPFARAYKLEQTVNLPNWNLVPGNIGQVYERFVLPTMRDTHPELVGATWDRRIQLETQLLKTVRKDDEVAQKKFAAETMPRLQWRRSADVFRTGQQTEGALAMLKLLQQHADHADAGEWIQDFRQLLEPPAPKKTP
jgi:hypothetical protein